MSLTVTIFPASLWIHAMLAVLSKLEKSGTSRIDQVRDSYADLLREFQHWTCITSTSHEGPWQRARHSTVSLTGGSADASSIWWGEVVNPLPGPFRAGGELLQHWISRHVNSKEMFALHHVLRQFCMRFPDVLRRVQVYVDVDNQSGWARLREGERRAQKHTRCWCNCSICRLTMGSC